MTSDQTPDHAWDAPGPNGDLFRSAPDADASGLPHTVPDESEAAMTRLRAPFDTGPVDVPEHLT